MPSRSANFPALVLDVADREAAVFRDERHGLRAPRYAVLAAACRVACLRPPRGPVAYPSLNVAVGRVVIPALPDDLHAAVRAAERGYFYRRLSWLCFYGLVVDKTLLHELLYLAVRQEPEDVATLARRDREAYELHLVHLGGQPCRIPTTARAPGAKRRR